jgi:formylglycine-generating enzyme required for sulfatase activity
MCLINRKLLLFSLVAITTVSFSPRKKKQFSLREIERNMRLIPGNYITAGINDKSTGNIGFGMPNIVTPFDIELGGGEMHKVDTFYLCRYEISNFEYRSFLEDLKKSGDTVLYKTAVWDTLAWVYHNSSRYNLTQYYHSHPLYNDFPAVNMSYEGAVAFCHWLTDKYNAWPKRKFKKVIFTLPDELEWMIAAGGHFPFYGHSLIDAKGKWTANFKVVSQLGIISRETNDTSQFTGEISKQIVYSIDDVFEETSEINNLYLGNMPNRRDKYRPHYYGLFNMAGNVAEMLAVKGLTKGGSWNSTGFFLRNTAREQYNDTLYAASPFKGFRIAMHLLEK